MALQVCPLLFNGTVPNIPIEVLGQVYYDLVVEDKIESAFYDGSVTDENSWLRFLINPENRICFVVDDQTMKIHMMAWLNNISLPSARGHFCAVGSYRRGAGGKVLEFWKNCGYKVIVGVTPASNDKALKLVRILKFQRVGEIPHLCNLIYEGKTVPGILSYYEF